MAFSNAWKDKDGKDKHGVKIRDLKSKPKYTPEPLKPAAEPEQNAPMFGRTRKDDK